VTLRGEGARASEAQVGLGRELRGDAREGRW